MSATRTFADVYLDTSLTLTHSSPERPTGMYRTPLSLGSSPRTAAYMSRRLRTRKSAKRSVNSRQSNKCLKICGDSIGCINRGMNAQVRQEWMDFGPRQYTRFRQRFAEMFEVPFREPLWHQSINLMAQYGLKGHDAIHAATALNEGVQILATNDSDSRRVDSLVDVLIVREG